ncbi:MAG TPA: hypothetical protein VFM99_10400, partial [Chitinophagales bacterium]|nr:hypothetical protein [Chitinophagales bacterium]
GWNNFDPLNTEFSNKGRDRDGDIKNCSWKAIANGSLLPSNIDMNNVEVPFNPGDVLATFNITGGNTIIKKDYNIWDELVDLGLGLLAGSNLRINGTIFSQRNSGTSLVYHRDVYVGILGHNAKDDTEFTEVNDSRPIDCSNSSFTTLGQDVDLVKFKVFCNGYVPVFSSLAVRANPLVQFNTDFSDVSSIINSNLLRVESYVGPVSPLSSFTTREDGTHETYRSQLNQLHCFNSDRSFAFLAFDLLTAAKLSLSELDHQTFNFGNLSAEI